MRNIFKSDERSKFVPEDSYNGKNNNGHGEASNSFREGNRRERRAKMHAGLGHSQFKDPNKPIANIDMSRENFPELETASYKPESSHSVLLGFSDTVKNSQSELNASIDKEDDIILPNGWALITKTPPDNDTSISIKYGRSRSYQQNEQSLLNSETNYFSRFHEKRTENYIRDWGIDEYEFMFRFPNYDYDYFNRLDELYEEEISIYESNDNFDYESNSNYDFDYDDSY